MEYVYLLHTAASLDDQLQRMQVKITCYDVCFLLNNSVAFGRHILGNMWRGVATIVFLM